MNRRSFFRLLGGAAVVASTNPVHFLAPIQGWSQAPSGLIVPANEFLDINWVIVKNLEILHKNLQMSHNFYGPFDPEFLSFGSKINIKTPPRFVLQ